MYLVEGPHLLVVPGRSRTTDFGMKIKTMLHLPTSRFQIGFGRQWYSPLDHTLADAAKSKTQRSRNTPQFVEDGEERLIELITLNFAAKDDDSVVYVKNVTGKNIKV